MNDAVETVVEDVLHRARQHDFNPADNTRDLVLQSADVCHVELEESDIDEAVEQIRAA